MKIVIEIPEDKIPTKQDILSVDIHFIDGKVCECSYPFQELYDSCESVSIGN